MSETPSLAKLSDRTVLSLADFLAEAARRFGPYRREWRFVCPSCDRMTSVGEWIDAGAPEGHIAFSCIGRTLAPQIGMFPKGEGLKASKQLGCNYAGGGLFRLNPQPVRLPDGKIEYFFDLAPAPGGAA